MPIDPARAPGNVRLGLVTLGVDDLARAKAFYEGLGWVPAAASQSSIAFYDLGGIAVALYGRRALADDASVADDARGFSAITLAINQSSPADVDRVLTRAVELGGKLVKPAAKVFWGGYSGYVRDPDGHLWEVAHNPFFPLGADGVISIA